MEMLNKKGLVKLELYSPEFFFLLFRIINIILIQFYLIQNIKYQIMKVNV